MESDSLAEYNELTTNESMVVSNTLDAFTEKEIVEGLIKQLQSSENFSLEKSEEKVQNLMNKYQEQPHLLDPYLDWMLHDLINICRLKETPSDRMHQAFKYLHLITKTRGYKVVVRHLPHEVSDLEPVLTLLSAQDPFDAYNWQTRYMLLLWLSIIIIIPFHLSRLDNISEDIPTKMTVAERVLLIGQTYICIRDACQQAATYLIAKFITRPDIKETYLQKFLDWAVDKIHDIKQNQSDIRDLLGILRTFALLFKHGKRGDVQKYTQLILNEVLSLNEIKSENTHLRKFTIKIYQRLGLTLLKPRIAMWRYQRGMRSLADNLAKTTHEMKPDVISSTVISGIDDDEDYEIPEEIETIIEQLLTALKDKETDVRWSAAKGIGRISGRLPKELVDEVVGSLLEFFTLRESDNAWHGGCLALAELGRRGLLLPYRLKEVVPVIKKALIYDVQRGNFSVGSNIRDAACYVCWSFARAYDAKEFAPYVSSIAGYLLITTVFDREINCRRAAAAAFQENVGRQGTFPHGIDIVTTIDFFSVAVQSNCYLNLSVYLAQFPEYTELLILHLLECKINHWDKAIRELTSRALHNLTPCASKYMTAKVVPTLLALTTDNDIQTRHGSIIALGEVVYALAKLAWERDESISSFLDGTTLRNIENMVVTLKNKKAFRGLGGELTRQGVNIFIEKISLAKLQFQDLSTVDTWQQYIDECLAYNNASIQSLAVKALTAFCLEYYQATDDDQIQQKKETLIENYLKNLDGGSENIRIGFGSAFGKLPIFMIQGFVDSITSQLVKCCSIIKPEEQNWAEARKVCTISLANLCKIVGLQKGGPAPNTINEEEFSLIINCLLKGMHDYTTTNQGDVGALVREATMTAFQIVIPLVVNQEPDLLTPEICASVMTELAQQCVEKIDRTRSHAIAIFISLLHSSPTIPHIPQYEEVLKIFSKEICESLNCNLPVETFPYFTQLLALPEYRYKVLLGLTVSVGGLTKSQANRSSSSFFLFLKQTSHKEAEMQHIGKLLLQIFEDHIKVPRVSLPFMKTMDHLLTSSYFDVLLSDSDNNFSLELFSLTQKCVSDSRDITSIIAAISVFCGLFQAHEVISKRARTQVMIYLCNKYPRVRAEAASKLYEALITYENLYREDAEEEILTLLSETTWNNPVEEIRPIRNKLCTLLDIPFPKIITHKKS